MNNANVKIAPAPADDRAWKLWGEIVSNPEATGAELQTIAYLIKQNRNSVSRISGGSVLRVIAAHPNAPPDTLVLVLELSPSAARAFCTNPVASLLLLEKSDFLHFLSEAAQNALLREETCPLLFVQMLAGSSAAKSRAVRNAARLHIAVAEEAGRDKWENILRDYWKTECAETRDAYVRQVYIELAELNLAPSWAKGAEPFPEPMPPAHFPFLDEWFRYETAPGSPEESALLLRFDAPEAAQPLLSRSLRPGATTADLHELFEASGQAFGLVCRAILRHPALDAALIAKLQTGTLPRYQKIIARHPQTPPEILRDFLKSDNPALRRLARKHKNAPPNARTISRRAFLRGRTNANAHFAIFVKSLHSSRNALDVPRDAEDTGWTKRLTAALLAPATSEPLPNDRAKRTGLDLLNHLGRDGNRIVRAAAQTRLANPDYKFVL